MILLTYTLSSEFETSELDWKEATEADFRYRLFTGDLTFIVAEMDFSARWGWIPIIDVALGIQHVIRELEDRTTSTLEFTESDSCIHFTRLNGTIKIKPSYVSEEATAYFSEFKSCSSEFLKRVLIEAIGCHPSTGPEPACSPMA
jgi:hypothetical protein